MDWFKKNNNDTDIKIDTELTEGVEYVGDEADLEAAPAVGDRYGFASLLRVTQAPHLKSRVSTRSIMLDVIIALLPAFIWGVGFFGTRSVAIGAISVGSAVLFEYLFQKILGRENTVGDLSAVVTGLLLAMNLSPYVPYWLPVIGSFFAIVVVKGLFGGIGKNIVNPALAARVFLFAWPAEMTLFPEVGHRAGIFTATDIVAGATPLTQIKQTGACDASVFDLAVGKIGGCIGEVSTIFLVLGGVYLLIRKVITWQIPVAYIGTVAAIALVFPRISGDPVQSMLTEILSGGLIIAAIFMATDYATSPVTPWGRIIFGAGCGIITMLIRYKGSFSEGVSYSILIMNLLVYYIEKVTMPKPYGGKTYGKKE